ncbi:MAG: aspartate-semialdehyde dehydrogenase [Desulfovibrionaceae bacterium]|nr:aspartate-semialdehyde dehydrogenase [Desulfovibrionaceae bacterium]
MEKSLNIAIAGATGAVGQEIIKILSEQGFPSQNILPLASEDAQGSTVPFGDDELDVLTLYDCDFSKIDLAFFCLPANVAQTFAQKAMDQGTTVIDLSEAFRLKDDIPLCVPEINNECLRFHNGLISSPSSLATALALTLEPIDSRANIAHVTVSALLSASDKGLKGINELEKQVADLLNMRETTTNIFPEQLAFNIIPYTTSFLDNDLTKIEHDLPLELAKIFDEYEFPLTVTCINVPIFYGHCLLVNITTEKKLSAKEVRTLLVQEKNLKILDNPKEGVCPMPIDAMGQNEIFIGRIRDDSSYENSLNLVIVFDNMRKGSALNAVQIANELIDQNLIKKH